jgi:hypothetical protein
MASQGALQGLGVFKCGEARDFYLSLLALSALVNALVL